MTAPLTPALALALLRELSVDVREAVVLDPAGAPVAGDAGLAPRAAALLMEGATRQATDASVRVVRTPDGGAIAVLAGDFALAALLEHDLAAIAGALATGPGDGPGT